MSNKYFGCDTTGVDADLIRHKIEEQLLLKIIDDCGSKTDAWSQVVRNTCGDLLEKLQNSKADVVSKIGKAKNR